MSLVKFFIGSRKTLKSMASPFSDQSSLLENQLEVANSIIEVYQAIMASPSSDRLSLLKNQFEVKMSIIEVYQTIMKRNQLNSTLLDDIGNKINRLDQAHEPINSIRSDYHTLLSSIVNNLREQSRTPPSNAVESLEHQMLISKGLGIELDAFVDVLCMIQRLREEGSCCPEKLAAVLSLFMSSLSFWTHAGIHPIADSDHALRDHCLSLLMQLSTCTNSVDGASSNVLDIENPPRVSHVAPIGKTTPKGSPTLDQKEDLEAKIDRILNIVHENVPKFGLFFCMLGYVIIYL
ncbi:uncharacterized protein A4U43_C03F26330 [Asparagus officinalis]|uniref:Uncharacterized protein n=1 Tax=Asparagus officinalis TaxID=4686 RepID=A0A5P1FFY1_ASPOF|nr:uncharacterized protein LOC109834425 [Asparagus officinalis]ONK76317.1 uncharacterized protein A4U43_C03F26330 [Asparagus officinalis]